MRLKTRFPLPLLLNACNSVYRVSTEHRAGAVHAVRARVGPVPRGGDAPRHGQLLRGAHGRAVPGRRRTSMYILFYLIFFSFKQRGPKVRS